MPTGIPTCPSQLDKIAKAEWRRISKELIALGLLTNVDRTALAGYCAAYSRWIKAEQELQTKAAVVKAPSGYPMPNPYIGIANTALDKMLRFLVEFGMTPASRSRLQVDPPSSEDPFAEFMRNIGAEDTEQSPIDEQTGAVYTASSNR
jgi:P27 family predicted phage terminase small subunit